MRNRFACEPLTANCEEVFSRREHAVIGISPGNSYYSEENIAGLLHWASREFESISVMIPDNALIETLMAAGYARDRAQKKAREACARLRNRAARAWKSMGQSDRSKVSLLLLSELSGHERYRQVLQRAKAGLVEDAELRECCLRLSRKVLASYLRGAEPTEDQAMRALGYLIAEMPLLVDSPRIFDVDSSTAIYYRRVEYIDRLHLCNGKLRPSTNQAFAVVRQVEHV
ncbi:tRNA-dependent cyclodipeptide synthase [Agrilutibacter solisilvae]|uniref:Cyclodipeptide synthase n=1 Tax=Agrilutibacter solisilvae TaxID=2763317 RepID=A0A975AS07_9GAMM|nr:tRNA-dependent cyclodipeptide synthase [Lysobacter solisilvae]QSX77485.1 tRNA-dependent cyclodipeptide synthase [Lysobacter solisilvae]